MLSNFLIAYSPNN